MTVVEQGEQAHQRPAGTDVEILLGSLERMRRTFV